MGRALGPALTCCVALARRLPSLAAVSPSRRRRGGGGLGGVCGFGLVLRALGAGAAQEAVVSPALGVFQGVIRVHLLEAEKLAQMDHFLGIRGKSDPYAKVSIGLQHFRSKTVYKNLSPTWNEVFEVRDSSATPGHSDVLRAPLWAVLGTGGRPCPHGPQACGATLATGAGLGDGQDGLRYSSSQTHRVSRGGRCGPGGTAYR